MADVLKVQKTNVVDADGEIVLLGVSADSQTVLSISICETGNADETFSLLHTAAGGGTEFYIYIDQSIRRFIIIRNDFCPLNLLNFFSDRGWGPLWTKKVFLVGYIHIRQHLLQTNFCHIFSDFHFCRN